MEMLGKIPSKKSSLLIEMLDQELSKGKGNPWRASDGGWFRVMLAISCVYKFAWREVSWRYYPATSKTAHKLDVFSGSLDTRCTSVIFIA